MKKLFISQPMKEKTNEEIRKEREDAIYFLLTSIAVPALRLQLV